MNPDPAPFAQSEPDVYWVRLYAELGVFDNNDVTVREPWWSDQPYYEFRLAIGRVRVHVEDDDIALTEIRKVTLDALKMYQNRRLGMVIEMQRLTAIVQNGSKTHKRRHLPQLRACEQWMVNEGYMSAEDTVTGLRVFL